MKPDMKKQSKEGEGAADNELGCWEKYCNSMDRQR